MLSALLLVRGRSQVVLAQTSLCTVTQATISSTGHTFGPFFSANGNRIVFGSNAKDIGSNADGNNEVFLVDVTTSPFTFTQITDNNGSFFARASTNANGTRVVFSLDFSLHLADVTTTPPTLTNLGLTSFITGFAPPRMISDAGTKIIFVSNGNPIGANADANTEIFLFDTVSNTFAQITDTSGSSIINSDASMSGDGTKIVFASNADLTGANADGNREIFLVDLSTSPFTFTQITNTTGSVPLIQQPTITSNGTRIMFRSNKDLVPGSNADGNHEIFLFDTTTSAFTQVTNSTGFIFTQAVISGNGTRAVFSSPLDLVPESNADGNHEIFLVELTTNPFSFTQITNTTGAPNNFEATINGDGTRLAFHSMANLTGANSDGSQEIFVAICNDNGDPVPPTAEAGASQSIHAGQTVYLDGNGSSDDVTPTENLQYGWSFAFVPEGSTATLAGANTATPTFVADLTGTYVVRLVVTDQDGLSSAPDDVTISSLNAPPNADAGPEQGAVIGNLITLDGSASNDPDLDPNSFSWVMVTVPVGSAAALSGANTANPTFVPDLPGPYVAQLIVEDPFGASAPDAVTIAVITGEQFAEQETAEAVNTVGTLPDSSVTTEGNQTALGNMLTAAITAVQSGDVAEAQKKLQDAIERTDGCALRGSPDPPGGGKIKQDYVKTCADQAPLYAQLKSALDALSIP